MLKILCVVGGENMQKEYRIDPELQSVMPELTEEEKAELEKSLLQDGFKGAPIIVWGDIIIDGHNRYSVCKKHNIPFEIQELQFKDKSEVIQWMIRAQLGRRNLIDAQKIALVKKFRPELEKQAKEKQAKAGGDKKSSEYKKSVPPMLGEVVEPKKHDNEVTTQLAKMANVGKETFRKAEKVLDSEKSEVKEKMLSGEKSINAAYKELQRLEKEGRGISVPKQIEVIQERKEIDNKISDNHASISKLSSIQSRYIDTIFSLSQDMEWLIEKEYFDNNGDEHTSKIRSELKNCMSKLEEVKKIISKMHEDDYGDENVIILEK
mgnify:CR=1 FL=1